MGTLIRFEGRGGLENLGLASRLGMAELIEKFGDGDVREEHMKYSHLGMESVGRLAAFMEGPLGRDLAVVPGIGEQGIKILRNLDIHSLDQLIAKFMSFDRDVNKMKVWCQENKIGGARFAETVVHALAMKCHKLLD